MTIRRKLITGFLLLGLFLAIQAATSFHFNDQSKALADQAIEKNFVASLQLTELTILAQKMRRYEKEAFIYVIETSRRERYMSSWRRAFDSATGMLQRMIANEQGVFSAQDIVAMQRWSDGLSKYGWEFEKVATWMEDPANLSGRPETAANAMIADGKKRVAPLLNEAPRMGARKQQQAHELVGRIDSNYELAELIFLVLTVSGMLVTGIIWFSLPGQIAGSLQDLIDQADQMSRGKLNDKVALTTVPEFDRLADALRQIQKTQAAMIERLQRKTGTPDVA